MFERLRAEARAKKRTGRRHRPAVISRATATRARVNPAIPDISSLFRLLLLLSSRMHGWQESERLLNIQTSRKPNANRDGPGKSRHDQPFAPKAVCLKMYTAGRNGKMVTAKKTSRARFKHRLFRPTCFVNTLTIMKPVNRGRHQHPTPASMRVSSLPKGQAPEIS